MKAKRQLTGPPFNLSDIPFAALAKLLPDMDGHTIFDPVMFTDAGISQRFVDSVTFEHESDTSDPKGTIFKDGEILSSVKGVYALTFLWRVASLLGVDQSSGAHGFYGRGSQARALVGAIEKTIKDQQS